MNSVFNAVGNWTWWSVLVLTFIGLYFAALLAITLWGMGA
jgi:hypothetical protein